MKVHTAFVDLSPFSLLPPRYEGVLYASSVYLSNQMKMILKYIQEPCLSQFLTAPATARVARCVPLDYQRRKEAGLPTNYGQGHYLFNSGRRERQRLWKSANNVLKGKLVLILITPNICLSVHFSIYTVSSKYFSEIRQTFKLIVNVYI